MADPGPILLAGLGGAALALALTDLARSVPALSAYLASAHSAVRRAGVEGREPTAAERQRLAIVVCLALGVVGLLSFGPGFAGVAAISGPVVAGSLLARRRRAYRHAVEAKIPSIAAALADSLAAGGSLRGALLEAASAVDGAARVELARVGADLRLGLAPREALSSLAARVRSDPLRALVAAVVSQQSTGGDLAALLRRQAAAAESRARAARRAETATAQARITGLMVVAMPFAAILLVELATPGFAASMLADPVAALLIAAAVGLQICGYLWIQRLGGASR